MQVSCGPAFNQLDSAHHPTMGRGHQPSMGGGHQSSMEGGHQPSMGGSSTNYGGASAKYGGVINQTMGGHQPSMGGVHQPTMGGPSAKYGGGIFPPVCTGSQTPENYFSNTYVLPSVNRTVGPMKVAQKAIKRLLSIQITIARV